MRMWRTMFSISTMASSTRIPVDSVIARNETRFSEKPKMSIAQNAGKIDSGSEIAAMMVARRSRKNSSTITTARKAPSNNVDFAAAEQRDHGAGEIVQRLGAGKGADRLVVLADFGAAAGEVDIGAAQALADIDGSQPRGLQPVGIERDQDFALDTANTLDLGDAAHALQRAFDDVVDEIGQLFRRLAGRDRSISDDRQANHVDALYQRLVDVLRQVGAHPRDGILDVVQCPIGIGLERELDRRQRQTVGDRGGDVAHAFDAGYAVFDRLGDLRFKFCRRSAELRYRNRDHGDVGGRQPRHRELGEGHPAQHQKDDREDDGWERVADRPCRDIESHQRTRRSISSANMVLIWSPSCSEEPASATTVSDRKSTRLNSSHVSI